MRINSPLLHKTLALSASSAVRLWMSTLDYQACYYQPTVDPAHPDYEGQRIFVFWHEYMLLPLHLRGHCHLTMLISRHRDAELLSHGARHLGFSFVRGSTSRGGVSALRALMRQRGRMNLAITPDGPRGPRRTLAQGPIYLASRLGLPLVAMGLGVERPWRMSSWDRFALPRPYTRARGIISPEICIPPKLDRDGIEHYRQEVERLLNRLTSVAENWAESGQRLVGSQVALRQTYRRGDHRYETSHALPGPKFWQPRHVAA